MNEVFVASVVSKFANIATMKFISLSIAIALYVMSTENNVFFFYICIATFVCLIFADND